MVNKGAIERRNDADPPGTLILTPERGGGPRQEFKMKTAAGEFVIPIRVRDENDLFSEFDPSGLSLSSDLTEYLGDYVEDRKLGERVCFEIRSDTRPDMERTRKAILLFIEKLSRRNRREIRRNQANFLRLLVIGILFIVMGIALAGRMNTVLAAIISTIGSFSVWEASAIWIETLPVLRAKDRVLKSFAEAEIRCGESSAGFGG